MHEPSAERHCCAAISPDQYFPTRSPERVQKPRAFLLTSDLHGCRQYGSFAIRRSSRLMPNRLCAFPPSFKGGRCSSLCMPAHGGRVHAQEEQKPACLKIVLRLPDLDHTKSAVLHTLSSPQSRRNYKFAMEQFITWYCSEPRLALNRAVVLRFRLQLESLGLAAGTVNQRLAAVRQLAYEATGSGLLSPELAAGIRCVKGMKQLGSRAGNWLTRDEAKLHLEKADGEISAVFVTLR